MLVEADDTGQTLREYVWLDDMPLAVVSDVNTGSPNLYFVHADHLDTPVMMTDGSKSVVWDAYFLPFGTAVAINGSATNNLRFPGQYFLIESGLHYNWYRHYDPTLGRYVQPDPIVDHALLSADSGQVSISFGMRGGQGRQNTSPLASVAAPAPFQDGPSLYAYAGSSPIVNIDPLGLDLSDRYYRLAWTWRGLH